MKNCFFFLLIITVAISVPGCSSSTKTPSVEYKNPFYTYDFGLDKYSPKQQVELLKSIGYNGIVIPVYGYDHLKNIDSLINEPTIKNGSFGFIVFFWYDLIKDDERQLWKGVIDKLKGTKTPIWLIPSFDSGMDDNKVISVLQEICDSARVHGLNIILYPHDGAYFEDAEATIEIIKKVNRKNLKTSMLLCHELRAGNSKRLMDVAVNVKPYLALASISGADTVFYKNRPDWSDAILPLDRGSFDARIFVEALNKTGYSGPIVLHTWGIKDEPQDHLQRSFLKWKKLKVK